MLVVAGSSRQAAVDRAIHEERDERLARLLAEVDRPGRLLDLGCSGGGAVAGIDRSAWQPTVGLDLDAAKLRLASSVLPSVGFVQADAARLPFPAGVFQVVVAFTLFSSVVGRGLADAVAAEVRRVLAPDGVLVWYDMRYPSPRNRNVRALRRDDIAALFPGWELDLHPTTLLPPLARRLGRLEDRLYPALARVPLLDSHWMGLVQPPGRG